jgi:hypothetical protein
VTLHWVHGRKIEKAIDYTGHGCHIAIGAEQYWHGIYVKGKPGLSPKRPTS